MHLNKSHSITKVTTNSSIATRKEHRSTVSKIDNRLMDRLPAEFLFPYLTTNLSIALPIIAYNNIKKHLNKQTINRLSLIIRPTFFQLQQNSYKTGNSRETGKTCICHPTHVPQQTPSGNTGNSRQMWGARGTCMHPAKCIPGLPSPRYKQGAENPPLPLCIQGSWETVCRCPVDG